MIPLPRTSDKKNRAKAPGNQPMVELLDKQVLFMKISAAWHNGSLEEHPELLEEVPLELMDELSLFVHHDNPGERLRRKKRREEGTALAGRGFSG